MENVVSYIVPILLLCVLLYCLIKNINAYDHFVKGASGAISLCVGIFPYLVAIFFAIELFTISGLSAKLSSFVSPFFSALGIPAELTEFLLLRPFTGSGSLAMLNDIYTKFGPDSYVSRCASVIMSTSETVFYVVALYFGTTKIKKLNGILAISFLAIGIGTICACWLCRII